jgi:WD40 repeat protein
VNTGRLLATMDGHTSAVWGMTLDAHRRLLASGGEDGTVRLWELPSGRALGTLPGHTSGVYGVALSANGQLLASGGADGAVRLWEGNGGPPEAGQGPTLVPSEWRLLATLRGHNGVIRGVALTADGHLAASGGFDETVRLWDTTTGVCLRILQSARRYERLDITGLTGITGAQRHALVSLGALDHSDSPALGLVDAQSQKEADP